MLDLRRLAAVPDPGSVVTVAAREALLRGAGVVAGPVEALAESAPDAVHRLARAGVPVVLVGTATWDPQWSAEAPLLTDAPALGGRERLELWHGVLRRATRRSTTPWSPPIWRSGPGQVQQAVRAAEASARLSGGPVTADDLRRGVRAQNAAGLERLARRIEPEVGWDDLVLPPAVFRGLQQVAARARHRDTVLTDWRMRRGGGRGHGVIALFAGDSGTGKTMSAEVIAADLRLDLYTVNLATVVDKYVGETEKNLERIFAEAGGVNAVLFFDEADAIFGKRSDVRDAHDRYANIESAYLLQRLETFDGLAVLATNLRANIDEAFTRRLDAIIDFPAPTPELRRSLWVRCLADPLPLADDLDLDFLADSFELAGGNIRSAATTAAYLAAAEGTAGRHAAGGQRRGAGVPQARPAGAGAGVRPLLRADRRECPRSRGSLPLPDREAGSAPPALAQRRESVPQWTCTLEDTMHRHSADGERESLRPKAARLDEELPAYAGRAAAEKRPDVLGAEGLLGLQRIAGNAGVSALVEEERVPGPRRDQLGRAAARPRRTRGHGAAPGPRLRRRAGARRRRRGGLGAGGQRPRVHGRVEHRVPARPLRPRLAGGQDHPGPRADPRRAAAQRPGGRHRAPGGIKVSDPSDRFEREAAANAERVMAGPTVAGDGVAVRSRGPAARGGTRGGSRAGPVRPAPGRRGGRGAGPGPVRPARGRRGRGRRQLRPDDRQGRIIPRYGRPRQGAVRRQDRRPPDLGDARRGGAAGPGRGPVDR